MENKFTKICQNENCDILIEYKSIYYINYLIKILFVIHVGISKLIK